MSNQAELTRYGADNSGGRAVQFEIQGIKVLCSAHGAENNEKTLRVAKELAGIRPKLFATGYVRQLGPKLWLLNRLDRGFGEFGYEFDGWDGLFRRFDVQVTGTGTDKHGMWWSVESRRA